MRKSRVIKIKCESHLNHPINIWAVGTSKAKTVLSLLFAFSSFLGSSSAVVAWVPY